MARSQSSAFVQLFLKPLLLGLVVAAIVIVILPRLERPTPVATIGEEPLMSFASAFEKAAPAVVNIYTTQSVRESTSGQQPSTFVRLGSGVIMDTRGYILTANHVVSEVDEILVALQDGRVIGAQLIGSDTLTDLAVLRIDADNLSVIPRNAEYRPRAGDVVLAIGNPYNLGQTVTQGIISATGRISPGSGYSEFIQMDAAINEGNSGGALVNSRGELVGINSARYLAESGSTGIYFSVAYRLADRVMQQLIAEGTVTRGYLGIVAEQSFHEIHEVPGLHVDAVDPGSPADRAGLQSGDFIFELAGQSVTSVNQGLDLVSDTRPGTALEISFFRGQQRMQTQAVIDRLDSDI
ncbi:MAG: trypsin-like peptidase domain-containing protein [Idiomarina sp.]|nr:trypsin-like peptidase domain-containing protein [Idiomarina sp.]